MSNPQTTASAGAAVLMPTIIYLGGMSRSGSTLAERLLGELPGACPAGEVVHMWRRGVLADEHCGCGELFSGCSFWQKVGEAGFGGWGKVDVGRFEELQRRVDRTRFIPLLAAPALMPAAFRRALDEYLSYYQRLYTAIGEITGCHTVVDSSKHASLAFCLARSQLSVRIVHVVRDPRGVAHSWTKRVSRDVISRHVHEDPGAGQNGAAVGYPERRTWICWRPRGSPCCGSGTRTWWRPRRRRCARSRRSPGCSGQRAWLPGLRQQQPVG